MEKVLKENPNLKYEVQNWILDKTAEGSKYSITKTDHVCQ
jgi:hypothetical protein